MGGIYASIWEICKQAVLGMRSCGTWTQDSGLRSLYWYGASVWGLGRRDDLASEARSRVSGLWRQQRVDVR